MSPRMPLGGAATLINVSPMLGKPFLQIHYRLMRVSPTRDVDCLSLIAAAEPTISAL